MVVASALQLALNPNEPPSTLTSRARGTLSAAADDIEELIEDLPDDLRLAILESIAVARETKPSRRGPRFPRQKKYFVSYAWGDQTPEGISREKVVDELCAMGHAATPPRLILRDKNTLRLGDSISKFARAMSTGDRVFVILSAKYLSSRFCMFELLALWEAILRREKIFHRRACILALPDAAIGTVPDRIRATDYWTAESNALSDLLARRPNRAPLVGRDAREHEMMHTLSIELPRILATIADRIRPTTVQELFEHGFPPDDL